MHPAASQFSGWQMNHASFSMNSGRTTTCGRSKCSAAPYASWLIPSYLYMLSLNSLKDSSVYTVFTELSQVETKIHWHHLIPEGPTVYKIHRKKIILVGGRGCLGLRGGRTASSTHLQSQPRLNIYLYLYTHA